METYYHLGETSESIVQKGLVSEFAVVKFVVMGGSRDRMYKAADQYASRTGQKLESWGTHKRFALYKVNRVLFCSHGMGSPSFSILLHEITKLLNFVGAKAFTYMRVGTCGGIGVPAGKIVSTIQAYNGSLEPFYEVHAFGKKYRRPCVFSKAVSDAIVHANRSKYEIFQGGTSGTDTFYEGQGRLDGAIAEHDSSQRTAFLKRAKSKGILNFEMEACMFGAFTNHLGIPAANLCATIINREEGDAIRLSVEEMKKAEADVIDAALNFISSSISLQSRL